METETLEDQIKRILETVTSSKGRPTTPPPLSERQKSIKKRHWLDAVLKIKANHPQLAALENIVYDFCQGYKANPGHGRGKRLLLYGENGTGKSHTAKAISRWAYSNYMDFGRVFRGDANSYGRPPERQFRNWLLFIGALKAGFADGTYSQQLDEVRECELLILDDVGADNDPSKFGVEHLYLLLEAREHRWTIITTNVSPDKWEQRFERRISSRFLRNFTHVPLNEVPDFKSQ